MRLSSAGSDTETAQGFSGTVNINPISWLGNACRKMSGYGGAGALKRYRRKLESIIRNDFSGGADSELAERAQRVGLKLQSKGQYPDSQDPSLRAALEVELFALVCEASRRGIGLDPFESQVLAGMVMADGCIAELPTGEGKTLAAVFPACLHALSGQAVQILTFNDYLAGRDAEWMRPVYAALGLSVGCVREGMTPALKRQAYACDITYAAAREIRELPAFSSVLRTICLNITD